MDIFERFAPFIQDFIYSHGWKELRGIQIEAAKSIFFGENNLLLSSGTASGKTEAAFLPIITMMWENPPPSVGVLYISPLKALINDQFLRLDLLLEESGIPVTRWHGDASQTKKNALIKNPAGILQITPESLEGIITNKRGAALRMFSHTAFVIVDEVHYFMRDNRGIQLLSVLQRINNLTGNNPRRIGLSATLSDTSEPARWLGMGTGRCCDTPTSSEGTKRVRLHVERFENYADKRDTMEITGGTVTNILTTPSESGTREHYEYLFKMTLDKKTIVFTNSREETELVMANLREIALRNKAPDVYRVHHGNVSALIRETAERDMKCDDEKIVTGATVTLELGIDIGSLDQVVQIGAPISVSSFAQRLGRCGRRGQVPQILFTFVESVRINSSDIIGPINWEFVRTIAVIELYTRHRWVEPIPQRKYPYNMLYHQTISHLKSTGEMSMPALAEALLTLDVFSHITQDDYQTLLAHLLEVDHIERTERGGIILGREGEKIAHSHKFLTVFLSPEYLLVKEKNRTIGTVDKAYPPGTRFALAGRAWQSLHVDTRSKIIFVELVPGISVVDWDVDLEVDLHTRLLQQMRDVLLHDESYMYLSKNAATRLEQMRGIARESGILQNLTTALSDKKRAVFPWVGTRGLFTLMYALRGRQIKATMPWITSPYLEVASDLAVDYLDEMIADICHEADLGALAIPKKAQMLGKYNEFVPEELLRKQYLLDYLDFESLADRRDYHA